MISLNNVTKKYFDHIVLDSINLSINNSGIYILQGINGSGKSTIIKLISGIIYKSDGKIFNNLKISYLPDKFSLPKLMKVNNYLNLLNNNKRMNNILMDKYKIPNKSICNLSKGNFQKLGLLQTFNYDADCYILDEPLDGLDDFAKELVKNEILKLVRNDKIIIMSLHDISEFSDLNPKIYYVKDGKINEE